MVMVDVDTIAAYRWISSSSRLAWSKGQQQPSAVLHLSNEACITPAMTVPAPQTLLCLLLQDNTSTSPRRNPAQ